REKPERLRQERFLSDPEERPLERPGAQKAESLQLGDQVRSGPHPRCSPVEANGGLAKNLRRPALLSEIFPVHSGPRLAAVFRGGGGTAGGAFFLPLGAVFPARGRLGNSGISATRP